MRLWPVVRSGMSIATFRVSPPSQTTNYERSILDGERRYTLAKHRCIPCDQRYAEIDREEERESSVRYMVRKPVSSFFSHLFLPPPSIPLSFRTLCYPRARDKGRRVTD